MELDVLGDSLWKYPNSASGRQKIAGRLWRASECTHDMSPYFEYYSKQAQRFLLDGGRHVCVKTHSDVIQLAQKILAGSTRDKVYQEIMSQTASNDISRKADAIDNTIDFCASLLLMAEIGQSQIGLSGRTPIRWDTKCLKVALAEHFCTQKTLHVDNAKFGKLFTGRNLSRIGGLQIVWTTNLADHLRLIDDDQAVFVFHCASFLQFQARYVDASRPTSLRLTPGSLGKGLFPDGFINETLQTLALLFPSTEKATRDWLQSQRKSIKYEQIDATLGRCGAVRVEDRRLEKFSFWHDRLVILRQAFEESQPKTLSQWWSDRRNRVQWYTFWVAILVFVMTVAFGIIQSLEGALQVYYSYKAFQQGQN
ncbi:hypothetical protein B0T10DRAFT_585995 [Thelonectria olida]|uniref:Uncharacterized protein n=1 Tax=Thelonectria olida TaxID=1576542 RepID=A0A9P8VTX1_9HYPO|nr:hypothetical protein B0T10DRAFT_585995 [Thelonectria olida]